MDIKDVVHLRENKAKILEKEKILVAEIPISQDEFETILTDPNPVEDKIVLAQLIKGYKASRKIDELFFPNPVDRRKIKSVGIFNCGKVPKMVAETKMAFVDFLPGDIFESLLGISIWKKVLPGTYFVSGSPLYPDDPCTTFPAITISGEKFITLNPDVLTDERFFVGVQLIEAKKEKWAVC